MKLRYCKVNGENALFHKWSERSKFKQALLRGEVGGIIKYTIAIIEFENGQVGECFPEEIQFLDNKFNKYGTEVKASAPNQSKIK